MSSPAAEGGSGLQEERTALAWRRTGLSVAVTSLIALHVLPQNLGRAGFVLPIVGFLWSLDLLRQAMHRGQHATAAKSIFGRDRADLVIARTSLMTLALGGLLVVIVVALAR